MLFRQEWEQIAHTYCYHRRHQFSQCGREWEEISLFGTREYNSININNKTKKCELNGWEIKGNFSISKFRFTQFHFIFGDLCDWCFKEEKSIIFNHLSPTLSNSHWGGLDLIQFYLWVFDKKIFRIIFYPKIINF